MPGLGRIANTTPSTGTTTTRGRANMHGPMPEGGWAYGYEILAGRTSATPTWVRGHLLSSDEDDGTTDPGGADTVHEPGGLLAATSEIAVTGMMSYGGDGERYLAPLTRIVPLRSGRRYGIGYGTRGGELMTGLYVSWPAGTNAAIYQRVPVSSTGPFNPWAHDSVPANGQVAQQILYKANVKPNAPTAMSPSGLLSSAPSAYTGAFVDPDETIDGRANTRVNDDEGEQLTAYRIQLREVGSGILKWDATYTASSGEAAARAFSRAYGGSGSIEAGKAYE